MNTYVVDCETYDPDQYREFYFEASSLKDAYYRCKGSPRCKTIFGIREIHLTWEIDATQSKPMMLSTVETVPSQYELWATSRVSLLTENREQIFDLLEQMVDLDFMKLHSIDFGEVDIYPLFN